MKVKQEKGFSGIDVSISIVVLFTFITIVAMLSYNVNSSKKEVEYKQEAVDLAISEIENIKGDGFSTYEDNSIANGNSVVKNNEEISGKQGFYETVTVIDYTDLEGKDSETKNLVKKITVKITYLYKSKEQSVELSTVLSKEN